MRVLMISDVYFPRINGVSTSIQTLRRGLHALGHESVLIAPEYPLDAAFEHGEIIRIPSRYLPRDPEDRMMKARAIRALLPRLEQRSRTSPYPYAIHRPLSRRDLGKATQRAGHRVVSHVFRGVSASLRAAPAAHAAALHRTPLHDFTVQRARCARRTVACDAGGARGLWDTVSAAHHPDWTRDGALCWRRRCEIQSVVGHCAHSSDARSRWEGRARKEHRLLVPHAAARRCALS